MAGNGDLRELMDVRYDREGDILTFLFAKKPQPAVAEEAADGIWVRYETETGHVVTVDVLDFSSRVHAAFGPQLTYVERTDPERLEALDVFEMLQAGR